MNLSASFKAAKKLFGKHRQHAAAHDLYHDWGRVLIGFAIAFVLAGGAGGYMYYKVNRGGFAEQSVSTADVPVLDRQSFRAVVDVYAEKDRLFSERRQTPVTVVDPAR